MQKNPTIIQDMGNGNVRTSAGTIIDYQRSEVADYDDPIYRDVSAGVETGDWFTRAQQDVLAVVDVADLLQVLAD